MSEFCENCLGFSKSRQTSYKTLRVQVSTATGLPRKWQNLFILNVSKKPQTLCHKSPALQASEADLYPSLLSQLSFPLGVFSPLHTKGLLTNIPMVLGVETCSPLSSIYLSHGFAMASAEPVFLQACLRLMDCVFAVWLDKKRWEGGRGCSAGGNWPEMSSDFFLLPSRLD